MRVISCDKVCPGARASPCVTKSGSGSSRACVHVLAHCVCLQLVIVIGVCCHNHSTPSGSFDIFEIVKCSVQWARSFRLMGGEHTRNTQTQTRRQTGTGNEICLDMCSACLMQHTRAQWKALSQGNTLRGGTTTLWTLIEIHTPCTTLTANFPQLSRESFPGAPNAISVGRRDCC